MNKFPAGVACPVCGTELASHECSSCGHQNVLLGDVLCISPVAEAQLNLWQHQLYTLQKVSQDTVDFYIDRLAHADVLPASRERFEQAIEVSMLSRDFVVELFARVGVASKFDSSLQGAPVGILSEYYCHIVRDWAWQEDVSGSYHDQLRTLLKVWPQSAEDSAGRKRVLVLGPGAGRVAWELHCALGNVETTTLELNPALQLISSQLIREQSLPPFPESSVSPQAAKEESYRCWELESVKDADSKLLDSYHQLVGDIWQTEFLEDSFDFVVTSWFLDAHGRDNRDLLEKITRWLKPNGHWINTGPLLYPEPLPPEQKYTHQELKDLIALARFDFVAETAAAHAHLPSPLSIKKQYEEIWSFCAQYQPEKRVSNEDLKLPDWLVLHYLPVASGECAVVNNNPVMAAALELADGQRSIDDIVAIMSPNLPQGVDVKRALISVFAEMLSS